MRRSEEREVRQMARELSLDYDRIPALLSIAQLQRLLSLKTRSGIADAIADDRLPATRTPLWSDAEGKPFRVYYTIRKEDGIRWAYGRRRGPQPREGVPHRRAARRELTRPPR